jgi:hypothetical protein
MQQFKSREQSSDRKLNFLLALALMACGLPMGVAQTISGQESKGASEANDASLERWKILCGSQGMLTNVTEIPAIGCFRLSLGHKAIGDFAGHILTVSVNAQGEACQVDGAAFNCSGCIDASRSGCPAMLTVNSRDHDGFINFFVSRRYAEGAYVTNQENFDFEQRRLQSRVKDLARNPGAGIAGAPIPNGPYSSWPEESRTKTIAALSFRCTMVSVMQLANYRGSKEAGQAMAHAMSMACIDHQMPDDWPGHADVQTREREHFEKAKRLDPSISWSPDDLWREIAKNPKTNDTVTAVGKP